MKLIIGNKAYSSWSLRPWMVLHAFAIPFQETLVQLRSDDTRDRILALSPSGKVPALVDAGTTVWDSLAIIEYLADKHPTLAIWPTDRLARAHARCVSAEMHAGFQALRSACSMNVTRRFKPRDRGCTVAADVARITAIWREARQNFGVQTGGPFLYGAFSAADAMFAPVVTRIDSYSIDVDSVSRAYVDAVLAHPSFVAWRDGAVLEPWFLDDGEAAETIVADLRKPKA
jgi:glutathione S-transferase